MIVYALISYVHTHTLHINIQCKPCIHNIHLNSGKKKALLAAFWTHSILVYCHQKCAHAIVAHFNSFIFLSGFFISKSIILRKRHSIFVGLVEYGATYYIISLTAFVNFVLFLKYQNIEFPNTPHS